MEAFPHRSRCLLVYLLFYLGWPPVVLAQHVDEEVVVTATPGRLSANQLAQSVTVVGGDELDRVRAASLGETLESQPGLSASFFGAGASRPIVRGLAGARVMLMEDGVAALDVATVSADHAVAIDPLVARQVEIFRGPATLLYGSGAVGGVINTVTNRIPELAPEAGPELAVEIRGDTVARERAAALALDAGGMAFAWHVDAATRETDDYRTQAFGQLANSDLGLDSFSVGGSWLGDNSMVGVSTSGFATDYGIPTAEPDGETVRIDLEQQRFDVRGRWLGMSGPVETVSLRIGVNDYEHVEIEDGEIGTRFANDAWETRLEMQHAAIGRWDGAFGLQAGSREFSALGDEAFVPPVDTSSAGLFLVERFSADRWDLELGSRFEVQDHRPRVAASVDDSATSLTAAALRHLDGELTWAMNLSLAERVPAPEELFSNGPHLSSGTFEIGDSALGTEISRHLDIGIRGSRGELSWSLTVFRTDFDDFIYLRETGIEDLESQLPVFRYVQQDARFEGFEAELFAPIAELGRGEIDIRVFADLVRARLDDREPLPRIPPRRLGIRLSYHADRFSAGLELTHHATQNTLAPFETPTRGYTLVGADFSWSVQRQSGGTLVVFLRGSNLGDSDARRHASLIRDIAPLPGRNLSFGVRLKPFTGT